MPTDFLSRCEVLEECYEFMLAYAAQGLPADTGVPSGGQLRELLRRAAAALSGIAEAYSSAVPEPAGAYQPFLAVLKRDAADALAAIELVRAQPALSSQLIDNLNASIHLRALLTDLFLIDEALKGHLAPARAESS